MFAERQIFFLWIGWRPLNFLQSTENSQLGYRKTRSVIVMREESCFGTSPVPSKNDQA